MERCIEELHIAVVAKSPKCLIRRKVHKALLIFLMSFPFILGFSERVNADICKIPRSVKTSRPDPAGVPTNVSVGIFVIDIVSIHDVSQSFDADFSFSLRWHDPRLSEEARGGSLAGCDLRIDDIWHPHAVGVNIRNIKTKLIDALTVDADGNVTYRRRIIAELKSFFDLREFPFDTQELPMVIVSPRYAPEEVSFLKDEFWSGRVKEFTVAGWSVDFEESQSSSMYIPQQQRSLSRFDFNMVASRLSSYFIMKVLAPLALIVLMAWSVFWIDPKELGPQLGISTASVFTLIAFQFTLGYLLPRVSYLTRADKYLIGATILVFLALGEAIVTSTLARGGNEVLARRIDGWARWIYLIAFLSIVIFTLAM